MADITISKDRLYMLTVSALRYALGRASYIVGDTIQFISDYWKYLDAGMREVILRDLGDEIRKAEELKYKLGHDHDHNAWLRLRDELTRRREEGLRAES